MPQTQLEWLSAVGRIQNRRVVLRKQVRDGEGVTETGKGREIAKKAREGVSNGAAEIIWEGGALILKGGEKAEAFYLHILEGFSSPWITPITLIQPESLQKERKNEEEKRG